MKAMILAAGLGTRLRPRTLSHPKALVPVGGVPILERVICRLRDSGFTYIVVNVHHFAGQIVDFLAAHDFGVEIAVSDERERLLDTGGALLHAEELLTGKPGAVLVHNVDILSDAPLRDLMRRHDESGAAATLLTSHRQSSRRLVFDGEGKLCGWHNLNDEQWKPDGFRADAGDSQEAFSGIHVISPELIRSMRSEGYSGAFSIIDFYLERAAAGQTILHCCRPELQLIDIGKPQTLSQADALFASRRGH